MEGRVFYHIFNRGINRQNIFFEEKNYIFFLNKLTKHILPVADIYAYCLMPNHFHLLVRIKDYDKDLFINKLAPPEKAFRDFFISYAKAINKMYNRTGSLFQYKFKRKIVEKDDYFSWLVFYIHANPVKSNLSDQISEWQWSSYKDIISDNVSFLKRQEIIDWYGNKAEFINFHELNLSSSPENKSFENFCFLP